MQQRRRDPIGITRWSVWALPRRALFVVVLVDLLAAGSLVLGFAEGTAPQPRPWPITLAVLAVAGIVSTEASLGVERMRRQSERHAQHRPELGVGVRRGRVAARAAGRGGRHPHLRLHVSAVVAAGRDSAAPGAVQHGHGRAGRAGRRPGGGAGWRADPVPQRGRAGRAGRRRRRLRRGEHVAGGRGDRAQRAQSEPGRDPAAARSRRRRGARVRDPVDGRADRGGGGRVRAGLRRPGVAAADRPASRRAGPAAGGGSQTSTARPGC